MGKCHKVSIWIEELELEIELYALMLEEIGIVLGEECLMKLASYNMNLEEQFVEFN